MNPMNPRDTKQGRNFKKVTLMSNVKCHREAKEVPTRAELKDMVKRWSPENIRNLSSEKGQEDWERLQRRQESSKYNSKYVQHCGQGV